MSVRDFLPGGSGGVKTPRRAPLSLPRSLVGTTYVLHIVFGFMVAYSGSIGPHYPGSIEDALHQWGFSIATASAVALASMILLRRVPVVEAVASAAVFSLMSVYILSAWGVLMDGDLDAVRRSSLILLASLVPVFRSAELWNTCVGHWTRSRPND